MATWPITSVAKLRPVPARLNSISRARPSARVGSISGDRNTASTTRAQASRRRASPSAAARASTVDTPHAIAATWSDSSKASISSGDSFHRAWYQRAE